MVNVFNDRVAGEGKTEVVEKGDPDGTLFLINPDVRLLFIASKSFCSLSYPACACKVPS